MTEVALMLGCFCLGLLFFYHTVKHYLCSSMACSRQTLEVFSPALKCDSSRIMHRKLDTQVKGQHTTEATYVVAINVYKYIHCRCNTFLHIWMFEILPRLSFDSTDLSRQVMDTQAKNQGYNALRCFADTKCPNICSTHLTTVLIKLTLVLGPEKAEIAKQYRKTITHSGLGSGCQHTWKCCSVKHYTFTKNRIPNTLHLQGNLLWCITWIVLHHTQKHNMASTQFKLVCYFVGNSKAEFGVMQHRDNCK